MFVRLAPLLMDVVTGLLNGPRANSAFLLRSVLDPPWSLHSSKMAPRSP